MDLVELLQSRGLRPRRTSTNHGGEFRQERKADGVYYHGLQLNAIWRQRMLDEAFAGYGE